MQINKWMMEYFDILSQEFLHVTLMYFIDETKGYVILTYQGSNKKGSVVIPFDKIILEQNNKAMNSKAWIKFKKRIRSEVINIYWHFEYRGNDLTLVKLSRILYMDEGNVYKNIQKNLSKLSTNDFIH